MLPLRISGTSSKMACSRQLRCVAQLGPIFGILKPCGGMSMEVEKAIAAKGKDFKAWKTGKGTRASNKAAMLVKKPTRKPTRILIRRFHKSTVLLTSLLETTLMLLVTYR